MPLAIIGAGLGRTGTMSLKLAIEILGMGRCYHMKELGDKPDVVSRWLDAGEGVVTDWEYIYEGFSAAVDWPTCSFYKQLADNYKNAKVILTVRDSESWFNSAQNTIFHSIGSIPKNPERHGKWGEMAWKVVAGMFNYSLDDRDHCINVFNRHNEEVRKAIPAHRLLEFNVADGWGPLCGFLELPEPTTPFPFVNSRPTKVEHISTTHSKRLV